jgi:hypothetical protein
VDELKSTLCGMRQSLEPNGVLAFDMNHAPDLSDVEARRQDRRPSVDLAGQMLPQDITWGCIS